MESGTRMNRRPALLPLRPDSQRRPAAHARGRRADQPASKPVAAKVSEPRTTLQAGRKGLPDEYLRSCVEGYTNLEYRLITSPARVTAKLQKRLVSVRDKFSGEPETAAQFREVFPQASAGHFQLSPAATDKTHRYGRVPDSGHASHRGEREYQEDICTTQEIHCRVSAASQKLRMFAVYDGHGGDSCASYVSARLPELLSARLNEFSRKFPGEPQVVFFNALKTAATDAHFMAITSGAGARAGCTGTIVLKNNDELWTACTGDSPALLVEPHGRIIPLTENASLKNPEYCHSTAKRKLQIGKDIFGEERISSPGTPPVINMARCYGDADCVKGLSARPKILYTRLKKYPPGSHTLVIGSDGLFEYVNRTSMGELTHKLRQNPLHKPRSIASTLVDVAEAVHRKKNQKELPEDRIASDNTSALVAFI